MIPDNIVRAGAPSGWVNRRQFLGDDSVLGPLPVLNVPSFGVDSNLLALGVGALGLIWAFSSIGGRVRGYTRERSRRSRRRKALQEELRSL